MITFTGTKFNLVVAHIGLHELKPDTDSLFVWLFGKDGGEKASLDLRFMQLLFLSKVNYTGGDGG